MKKLLFFLLILLTWYLAAMYGFVSLLVLAVAEMLLLFCMFLVSRYLQRHVKIGFTEAFIVLEKRRKTTCPVFVENTGRLPSGGIRLRFQLAYWNYPGEKSGFLYGDAVGRGKSASDFCIDAPWCGLLNLSIKSACVYDYLSLFKARIPAKGELRAAVLPTERAMKLRLTHDFRNHLGFHEDVKPALGNGSGEIRQLREYAAGDPYRLIHWNQTARMDAPWVKEQEPEQEQTVWLFLDFYSEKRLDVQKLDAFFEVLFSLLAGLLQEGLSVRVVWDEPNNPPMDKTVNRLEDCCALMLRLYQSNCLFESKTGLSEEKKKGLCLDVNLTLFSNGREVFRFSRENYADELEQMEFTL